MILDNQRIISPRPIIPKVLKNKVSLFSNCKLSEMEIILFNLALQAVANHIEKDKINLDDYYKLNILFTENGKISFHEESVEVNGTQVYMAIYMMNRLRKYNNATFTIFVYIEELAHYFWRIYDETQIKYKIVDIIKYIVPDFTIDIAKGWGLNGL